VPARGFLSSEQLRELNFQALGEDVRIDSSARFYGAERISLGSHVRIDAYSVLSAGEGGIGVGSHVHISVRVFMTGAARIEIHDFAGIAAGVSIYSSNDDYRGGALTGPTVPEEFRNVTHLPVVVGPHVVVGAGSVVLPGVTIERGAAAGALTLVRRDVPEFAIVAGPKGEVIGERSRDLLARQAELMAQKGLQVEEPDSSA
jgi:acetyltransferase-like isoleucine patch superfamily enzyme